MAALTQRLICFDAAGTLSIGHFHKKGFAGSLPVNMADQRGVLPWCKWGGKMKGIDAWKQQGVDEEPSEVLSGESFSC